MKNASQVSLVSDGFLSRFILALTFAPAALIGPALSVQATDRIVAWGDIHYDVNATIPPATRGPAVL